MPVANEYNSYFMKLNADKQRIKLPQVIDRKLKDFDIWDWRWMKWGWHRGPKNNSPQAMDLSSIIYDRNNEFVEDTNVRKAKLKALQNYYKRKGYTLPPITMTDPHHKSSVKNWMPGKPEIITLNSGFGQGAAPLTPEPNLRATRLNMPVGSPPLTVNPTFTAGRASLTQTPYPITVVNPLRALRVNMPVATVPLTVNPTFTARGAPVIQKPYTATVVNPLRALRVNRPAATGGSTRRRSRNKKITRRRKSS